LILFYPLILLAMYSSLIYFWQSVPETTKTELRGVACTVWVTSRVVQDMMSHTNPLL
jgi:hypothetical protein